MIKSRWCPVFLSRLVVFHPFGIWKRRSFLNWFRSRKYTNYSNFLQRCIMMHPCRRLLLDIYFFERKSALRWWLLRNSIVEMIKLRKDYMEFVELVWGTRQMMACNRRVGKFMPSPPPQHFRLMELCFASCRWKKRSPVCFEKNNIYGNQCFYLYTWGSPKKTAKLRTLSIFFFQNRCRVDWSCYILSGLELIESIKEEQASSTSQEIIVRLDVLSPKMCGGFFFGNRFVYTHKL